MRLAERDVDGMASNPDLRRRLFAALEKASRGEKKKSSRRCHIYVKKAYVIFVRACACVRACELASPPTSMVALSPTSCTWNLRGSWSRAEMQGAAGPPRLVVPERYALYYPPDLEEQVGQYPSPNTL